MALKSTVYKADIQIADMDRHYYSDHMLTLAKHPSETDERLMVRLLAFVMFADPSLVFGKDISSEDDEPTLWRSDLTGAIDFWIEIGQPDERIIRKACGRAKQVVLIAYGKSADLWWKHNAESFIHKPNLNVIQLAYEDTQAVAALAKSRMSLTCNIEDKQIWLMDDESRVKISPIEWYRGLNY